MEGLEVRSEKSLHTVYESDKVAVSMQAEAESALVVEQEPEAPAVNIVKAATAQPEATPPAITLERRSDLRKSLVFIMAYLMMEVSSN